MTLNWNLKPVQAAIVVLTTALVLRLAWAIWIPVVPLSDSVAYDTFANMIATHGVFGWTPSQPSSFWPVGTSALYAALYTLFGHHFIAIVGFNNILSTIVVGLTIWLARLFFDNETAIVAGSILAIWPSEVAYVTILASELPFTFFVLLGYCAWFSPRLSDLSRGATSGLAFAAATYVRPVALLLPILLWLTNLRDFHKLRGQLSVMLLAMAVIAVCIAPWSIRNTRLYGHFMLLSSNGGVVLWEGNNPDSVGVDMAVPDYVVKLTEYERDKELSAAALRYITDHPVAFVLRTAKKAILLHLNETIAVHWNAEGIKQRIGESAILPLKLLMQAYWSLLLLLALAGIVVLIQNNGPIPTFMHPIVATWIYFTAVYSVMLVQDRYHFPSHPLIAMLAAIAIVSAVRRVQGVAIGARL
jgi:4-amino-4-deoxy-L-arabinose transferase-like glycosyltransferase